MEKAVRVGTLKFYINTEQHETSTFHDYNGEPLPRSVGFYDDIIIKMMVEIAELKEKLNVQTDCNFIQREPT